MRFHRSICLLALGLLACDDRTPLPLAPIVPEKAAMVLQAPVDVSGSWDWSEEVVTKIPPEILALLGLEPEGSITHATCVASGTLQLVQTGAEFSGAATQTATCRTSGGQEFEAFPPFLSVEGTVKGRSLHFQFGACTYTATVVLDAGMAVRLRGTGMCHDLPPTALLKSTLWVATRP